MNTVTVGLTILVSLCLVLQTGCAAEHAYGRTDVGAFEVKKLSSARTLVARERGQYFEHSNTLFRRLFDYIKKNDIPMTAPVEMRTEPATMIFVVDEDSADRKLEPSGGVEVERLPARVVASHGARGGYNRKNFEDARDRLLLWVDEDKDHRPAGEPYGVYWQGPFVPAFLKHFEVHMPVDKIEQDGENAVEWTLEPPEDGGVLNLSEYQWEHRLLIVFSGPESRAKHLHFEARLTADAEGVLDRELLMMPVGGTEQKWSNAHDLAERYELGDDDFLIVLIGKDSGEMGGEGRWMTTIPRCPSTVIRSPDWISDVASGTPVTQGNPYSRAMMAPWISMPPRRSTTAEATGTMNVMFGSMASQTMISLD